jgi:hypothetical protein
MMHSHPLKTINALVFYASCILLVSSCWQRNEFPAGMPLANGMMEEPEQRTTDEPSFKASLNGVEYTVAPRYRYDLTGLVVSYEHHDGNYSLHRLWKDHINVADVCVVWGHNAAGIDLNKYDFWNGAFTCNFQTRDSADWERFRLDKVSNNHLLAADPYLRKLIKKVRIGDQIRIRGWLADYSNDQGFSRGTSITREDTGNRACETVYVNSFTVLESMDNGWRRLLGVAVAGVIITSLIWFIAVIRGVF